MINEQLLNPRSIVIVGGSNDIEKPGGAVLKNILEGGFRGDLYVTNLKEPEVQGIKSYTDISALPHVDLAIIAIAAKLIPDVVEILTVEKNTRAFIILSAGFSEEGAAGKILEEKVVDTINRVNGALIGPNCIGVLTPGYNGVFTKPIPLLDPQGCDFISGSGATACFIMEMAIPNGLTFARVFSIGNSAQMGIEEILQYMDETYETGKSSRVKLLYIEHVSNPAKLLKHASSLVSKGCKIAAIKAGTTEAGTRAATSHTGALASPDMAVDALFRKAGIVRCYSREELISVTSVFMYPELKGKNIAIITHAGGPAVMLTDALSDGGLAVPVIDNDHSKELLAFLNPGSSVANPIDFLATGNAVQLGRIIDYVDQKIDIIDGMVVIFGTPGLRGVFDVYGILDEKMRASSKPIFPVMPSIMTAKEEMADFISRRRVIFTDEVLLGKALAKTFHSGHSFELKTEFPAIDRNMIRSVIRKNPDGYLAPGQIHLLLDASGIPRAAEAIVTTAVAAVQASENAGFPVVMKVVGPVHKSDVGGVALNVDSVKKTKSEFKRMIRIKDTTAILIQPMLSGLELFTGVKFEPKFGHLILCGLGGIFIEVLKDVACGLSPLSMNESLSMIRGLKSYPILRGVRGKQGADEKKFAEIMVRLSALIDAAPEIVELDFNPMLGNEEKITVVDARISIRH